MKLKNRIMSWILAPGAYMVWHAMGTPEEWKSTQNDKRKTFHITHAPTNVTLWTANGGFFLDGHGSQWENSIGLLDRHFLWPRAKRVVRHLRKEAGLIRGSKSHKLFIHMTQLTGKQP